MNTGAGNIVMWPLQCWAILAKQALVDKHYMNLRQKWVILMKLSQITSVSHCHLCRGDREWTVLYLFTWFLCSCWLNWISVWLFHLQPYSSLATWERAQLVLLFVFLFTMVPKYYVFVVEHHFGTRAEGLMFWTSFILKRRNELQLAT